MQLSAEILDCIFSFLSHQETLNACSKDPLLFSIAEKHLYYHVLVNVGNAKIDSNYAFEVDHLFRIISENPHILNYVRILQIQAEFDYYSRCYENQQTVVGKALDEFAKLLLLFPKLECIMLTNSSNHGWYWPDVFQAALEDRLSLPTVKEIHLIANENFPISLLDSFMNIKNLSITGSIVAKAEDTLSDSTLPHLKSLTLYCYSLSSPFLAWVKLHIHELQTLKCEMSSVEMVSEVLSACSETLDKFRVNFTTRRSSYFSKYSFRTEETKRNPFPKLSAVPPNLRQLTIRAPVVLDDYENGTLTSCVSYLPAAAEVINLFMSSLRHLVLDIDIELCTFSGLTKIDFSPLAVLAAASISIPRIDLYVSTGMFPSAVTRAQLWSSLEVYEDLSRLIEAGGIVIHSEETAPDVY